MVSLLTLMLLAANPTSDLPAGAQPETEADKQVAALSERYLDEMFATQPVQASYVGFRKHDGVWPDYSDKGVKAASAMFKKYDKAFAAIDKKKLSRPFAMDVDILRDNIAQALFELQELKAFEWDPQIFNEAVGAGFFYLTSPPRTEAEWPARLQSVLQRLDNLPKFLATARERLKKPSKVHTEFVIGNNPGNKDMLKTQIAALFDRYPKDKLSFEQKLPAALKAIDDFQTHLEKEALPKATRSWKLGADLWKKKLRFSLQSQLEPKQLYDDAESNLKQARARMLTLAEPLFKRFFPDDKIAATLQGDERLNHIVGKVIERVSERHGTPDTLFVDVQRYSQRAIKFIKDKDLVAMPPADDNFVIEPTPPFLDGMAVAFFNPSPALEPWLKKSYWISSVPKTGTGDAAKDRAFAESFLREYNEYGLQTLTIHEAFPGHYVQLYWSQRSPVATTVKRVVESGTMAEGWAVMIEDVLYDAGYAEGEPENQLFHLKMNLRTYMNTMIDQRLHTSSDADDKLQAWALDLMMKQGFQEEAEAKRKVRRAQLTSTQLSTYFVGYREMRSILDAAVKKAGPNAKLRPTLDKMLSYGTITPRLIRELLAAEGLI